MVMNLTPIEFWCWSCFARGRSLVNGSATFRSICTLQMFMSSSSITSLMELKRRFMCLVHLWNLGSLARAMAPVLSHNEVIGSSALGTSPRSVMNCFIQTPSFAASEATMYSASHVESAIMHCLELHQLTAPPFIVYTYTVWDFESSR